MNAMKEQILHERHDEWENHRIRDYYLHKNVMCNRFLDDQKQD